MRSKTEYLSDEKMEQIRQMWSRGCSRAEAIAVAGVSGARLFDRGLEARGRGHVAHPSLREWPLPPQQGRGGGRQWERERSENGGDPTSEQIASACETIRDSWDELTRQERKYEGAPDLQIFKHRGSAAHHFRRMHRHEIDDRHRPD
jgi:hypothetical protein